MQKLCFAVCHTSNMDEIFQTFNLSSGKTVGIKGVKLITIKISDYEKTHYPFVGHIGKLGVDKMEGGGQSRQKFVHG